MDPGILDQMLNEVATVCVGSTGSIAGLAKSTFMKLILLDLVVGVMLNLMGEMDHLQQYFKKILKYGFWIWVISNWGMFCNVVLNSLMMTGTQVGGVNTDILRYPSVLIDTGIFVAKPYFKYLSDQSWATLISSPLATLLVLIGYLGIILAFSILAFQVFITYVEFYISSALLLIFIPFAGFTRTAFLAEKAIGAVLSYGTKLMMLGAIYGLASGIIERMVISFPDEPSAVGVIGSTMAPFALSLLCWQAPGMAAGLMTGAPSLTAGTMAGTAMASAAGATTGVIAGAGIAGAVGAGGLSAARAAAGLAGAATGAGNAGANLSEAAGAAAGYAASSIGGAVKGAAVNAWNGSGVGQSFDSGKVHGFNSMFCTPSQPGGGMPTGVGAMNNAVPGLPAGGQSSAGGTVFGNGFTMTNPSSGSQGSGTGGSSSGSAFGSSSTGNNANFSSGGNRATTGAGSVSPNNNSTPNAGFTGAGSTGSTGAGGSSSPGFQDVVNKAQQSVPQDAQPEGGFNFTLPQDD